MISEIITALAPVVSRAVEPEIPAIEEAAPPVDVTWSPLRQDEA